MPEPEAENLVRRSGFKVCSLVWNVTVQALLRLSLDHGALLERRSGTAWEIQANGF